MKLRICIALTVAVLFFQDATAKPFSSPVSPLEFPIKRVHQPREYPAPLIWVDVSRHHFPDLPFWIGFDQ